MMKSIVEEALSRANADTEMIVDSGKGNGNDDQELMELLKTMRTEISVVGCGGGGSNTITRMYEEGIDGAKLFAVNTDAQHLIRTKADKRILIGRIKTKGFGAGSVPQVGEEAALENDEEIRALLANSDMVFITAGLGGGTGTGSAPIVA